MSELNYQFCPYCGAKLVEQVETCPNCKRDLSKPVEKLSMNLQMWKMFSNPYKEGMARYQETHGIETKKTEPFWKKWFK